jgi:phosphate-selective porin
LTQYIEALFWKILKDKVKIQLSLLSAILFGISAHAQDKGSASVEERLRKLEQEVKSLREENLELKSALGQNDSGKPAVVKPAGKETALKLGGLIQAQADFLDKGDSRWGSDFDRFYLRRVRLNASGSFLENFDFRIELELAGGLGEAGGLRAQLTDGFINYHQFQWANVRVGQFKTPFGFEQLYSDSQLLTIERSLANDRLTLGRQIGGMITGDLFDQRLAYSSGVFNGNGVNTTANDNDSFTFVQRISGTPWRGQIFGQNAGWRAGLDGFVSDDQSVGGLNDLSFDSTPATASLDGTFAGYRIGAAADTQFHLGPFDFWAEYLRVRFKPENELPASAVNSEGWCVLGGYYLIPEKLQAVLKFESFDPDTGLPGNSTDAWTLGLNYYILGNYLKAQLDWVTFDAANQQDRQNKLLVRLQAMF